MSGKFLKLDNFKKSYPIYFLAFLVIILLFMIIYPHNLGFAPDSMVYLEVAENVLEGLGFTEDSGNVVKHYPPLFPLGIAAISYFFGIAPQKAGIILQPLLLGICVFIFHNILVKVGIKKKLVIFSTLLLVVSQLVTNFLYFLSEGMFMAFLFATTYFIICWEVNRNRKSLISVGFFCGLLFLTRYAAVGFIAGYFLFILLLSENKLRRKNALYFLIALAGVVLPWIIYIGINNENPSGRNAGFYIISLSKIIDAFKTFGYWFAGSIPATISTGLLLILYFILGIKHKSIIGEISIKIYQEWRNLIILLVLISSTYFFFLIFSISFYDPWTPLDNRILSPIFPFILILITIFFQVLKLHGVKWLLSLSIIALFLSFSSSFVPVYLKHYENGGGYTSEKWENSETVDYLRQQKSSRIFYTNGIEIARLHANKQLELLPFKSNEPVREELLRKVKSGEAGILFFNEVNWRNNLISRTEILSEFDDEEIRKFSDGFMITISE